MTKFDIAVKYVLNWEKGLVNNPGDPGGLTNRGISIRFLRSIPGQYCSNDDNSRRTFITNMTEFMATKIYQEQFWKPIYEQIREQDVMTYIFDMIVNLGQGGAIKICQRALWAHFPTKRNDILVDGSFGDQTLSLLNNCGIFIMPTLRGLRADYYGTLARNRSELAGLLNRAYGL